MLNVKKILTKLMQTPKVIESGTSGIWEYRKWSSGIAECWCHTDVFTGAFTTQWGSAYYTPEKMYNFPSGLFLSGAYPTVTCTVWDNGGLGWATVKTLNYKQVGFILSNPASTTRSTQLYIQAQGKWK